MPVCFLLCPECGEDLAEVYPFYNAVKDAYFQDILDNNKIIDIDKVDLKSDLLGGISFILDAICINKMCCRVHMMGCIDIDTIYY